MGDLRLTKGIFGHLEDGSVVDLYTLRNRNGVEVGITTFGGAITFLKVPDNKGNIKDVVLGFDKLEDYVKGTTYFGVLIGRYGNRIAKGKFSLGGKEYTLATNNGENHLHGGLKGFDKVLWRAKEAKITDEITVELSYTSKDGEEGYPGELSVNVAYTLTNNNELKIHYTATTNKETIVNLTNHSYFNLAGHGSGSILNHQIKIEADQFTPVDKGLIPTGELRSVKGTPMDFTEFHTIGERIEQQDEQLQIAKGYDHNWVLQKSKEESSILPLAATAIEPTSGRVLEVFSSEPGIQFYTGNFLNGVLGKDHQRYEFRDGFCLETQHFPDSPNKPQFPSTVLQPNKVYNTTTVFKFSTKQ